MSSERPQREVAIRLFAAEFEDSELTYAESDEERAPNYVVTPTGARANRVFVVGVLTEVERVNDDVLRARIVDPTGAFVVYAGQYQPEALAFFERTDAPAFVAVTGKARTFQPDDSDVIYTSVRPESANEVTAETRDRWVVQTAERTIDRLETFAGAVEMAERGDALADALERRGVQSSLAAGIPKAMDYYGTTTGYLNAVHRLALDATRVVANELDEVDGLAIAPDEGGDEELEFDYTVPERSDEGEEPGSEEAPWVDDQPTAEAEAEQGMEPAEGDLEEGKPAEPEVEQEEQPAEAESEQKEQPADDETETDRPEDDVSDEDETESTVEVSEAPEEPTDEVSAEEPTADTPAEEPTADTPAEESGAETSAEEPEDIDEEDEPVTEIPAEDDELEESDEMYELSEEEREAVEAEYDVGFETGNEVGEPGDAGIETPEPEAADETAPEESAASTEDAEAEDDESESSEDSTGGEVDLEDRVVETMAELDDGDGAPRAEVVSTVAEAEDVSTEDVEAAIQDALMGGRCYEPSDDRITPI